MYDAIVVGARCAGSPTAMLLARRGLRVLLVDKAHFPSDTLSTHYIHQPGVAALKRWGLLPQIERSGCPPIRRYTLDVGPFALEGTPPPIGDVGEAYSPRRYVLDQILVEAAAEAGAEVRQGFTVQELLTDGERVVGIRGRSAAGEPVTERARIVIGADGMNSLVARSVKATRLQRRARADVRLLHLLERSRDGGRRALSATRPNDRRLAHQRRTSGDDRLLAK